MRVADAVWTATALLHRENPVSEDFEVQQIVSRAVQEKLVGGFRPGLQPHASWHCVANKKPNGGRYRISPPARQDLIDIRNFIAKDNRAAARKVLARIRAACRMLAKRPQVGHLRADLASEPLRFWPVYSYLIIYRPNSKPIEVVRVLQAAADAERFLASGGE